jgi:predicted RNA-binding protein with PIN domain
MTNELQKLLLAARKIAMTDSDKEEQRRSFAYGSAKIENDDITREMVNQAAERLRQKAYG